MPYWSASKSTTITVQKVTVEVTASPMPPWKAGQTVNIVAKVTADGSPLAGETVQLYLWDDSFRYFYYFGSFTTGSDGTVTKTWTVPFSESFIDSIVGGSYSFTLPCNKWYVEASCLGISGTLAAPIAYPTDITLSVPSKVPAGLPFEVKGKLTYEASPGSWRGLGGKKVQIYVDDTKIGEVETDSEGNYSLTTKITTPGTYTVKAVFPGEGLTSTAQAVKTLLTEWTPSRIVAIALPAVFGGLMLFKLR